MLGEALKQLRLFYGVKQKDLAERLDVSSSYLSEIELGNKPNIPLNLLYRYSEIFNVKPSHILLFAEKMQEGAKTVKINKRAAEKILKIMMWISEKRGFEDETA